MTYLSCALNLVYIFFSLLSTIDEINISMGTWRRSRMGLIATQLMLRRSTLISWRATEGFTGINCTIAIAFKLDML